MHRGDQRVCLEEVSRNVFRATFASGAEEKISRAFIAPKTFAAVPFLVFAAPFIIMRNTLRGIQVESRRIEFVMMATVIASFWSMMSGTFFLMTLRAAGIPV